MYMYIVELCSQLSMYYNIAEFGDFDEQKHTDEFLSDYIFLPPVGCTHTHTHAYTHTHTHIHTYIAVMHMTLIGVFEMHGQVHPK